jgi:hypothetical protein
MVLQQSVELRVLVMIIFWLLFLSIPFFVVTRHNGDDDPFPLNTLTTMIKSAMIFMVALKLNQLIWFPKERNNKDPQQLLQATKEYRNKKEAKSFVQTTETETTIIHTRLYGWARFGGSLLYYFFPISRSMFVPTWSQWLRLNFEFLGWIGVKMIAYAVVVQWMEQILEEDDDSSTLKLSWSSSLFFVSNYAKLVFLFSIMVLAGSWNNDVLCCVVYVLSLGYYEVLTFSNYPFLSTSLKDFWGRKYNLLTHTLLKECVYIPAQNYAGCSKRKARYLTFAVSGLMHVYIVHFTFRRGYLRTMAFFLLQPLWIDVENYLVIPAGRTHLFFWLTLFLYIGLFVDVLPDYLKNSVVQSIHPWMDKTANQIIHWLSYIQPMNIIHG